MLLSLVQTPWSFCLIFAAVPTISFYIGSCWLFIAFAKDIKNDLDQLHIAGNSKRSHMKVMERFCNNVQAYSNAKELSDKLLYSIVLPTNYHVLYSFEDVLAMSTLFMSSKFLEHLFGQ